MTIPLFREPLSAYLRVMIRLVLLALLLWGAPARADCVVLLHGLARTETSFLVMEEALKADRGYWRRLVMYLLAVKCVPFRRSVSGMNFCERILMT